MDLVRRRWRAERMALNIWIDIKNSHEPAFFKPFLAEFADYDFFISSREYAEIQKLLNKLHIENKVIGRHYGGLIINKMLGLIIRNTSLFFKVPKFDISLSHGSVNSIHVAKMRLKRVINFTDNEKASFGNKISFRFVDYLITPTAISVDSLVKQGAKEENVIQYNGFKEDVYVADFRPDPNFLDDLPFDDFITIRPEALQAAYVSKNAKTIVPQLLSEFVKENVNVLYLPRYPEDKAYAKGYDNVYIPPEPLNGLDVCYYTKAVLTGSGTFAREAACMGTPAVSFFPEILLAVDQKMVNDSRMFHSRDPKEIVRYVLNSKKRKVDFSRSKKVQREVFDILKGILEEIEDRRKGKK